MFKNISRTGGWIGWRIRVGIYQPLWSVNTWPVDMLGLYCIPKSNVVYPYTYIWSKKFHRVRLAINEAGTETWLSRKGCRGNWYFSILFEICFLSTSVEEDLVVKKIHSSDFFFHEHKICLDRFWLPGNKFGGTVWLTGAFVAAFFHRIVSLFP